MKPITLTPDEILKIHFALHREIDFEPNTELLTKICIDTHQKFADKTVDIDTIFTIAAEYGVKLAHFDWSPHTNRASETAFAVCMIYLNTYGLSLGCQNQALFELMREHWTTVEKFAVRLLCEYLEVIREHHNLTGTAAELIKMVQASIKPIQKQTQLFDIVENIRSTFTIDASEDCYCAANE
ncbi:MAG TPA: hypothetical protein DCS01_00710 [Idiomarina abyssalis]|uniref:hypothetical protein n=1 Tax=Idiomarina TaxID=135575 RepID=UPI000C392039|nr:MULTISPECIES: hypothetical protein [Idiomarina]MAB22046.1 hypothetical protein [Idiomarina sp.]MBH93285.1 hypothetical protein [Idiomarina sp.]HAS13800.1 hypothetical protein [Idiomarina abyssalis]|tara:strand:+ start:3746 stop:4294 length:549 start_codon:yes stop_codon:yes gene_type:complete